MDLLRRIAFLLTQDSPDGEWARRMFWTSSTEPDLVKQLELFCAKTEGPPQ